MRVLQALFGDPIHRSWFAQAYPQTARLPFARQVRAMLSDGLGAARAWAADLDPQETFLCFANDRDTQVQWTKEAGHADLAHAGLILAAQVAAFDPDVVLIDAGLPDFARLVRRMSATLPLIGIASGAPSADASAFDRIIGVGDLRARAITRSETPRTVDVLCRCFAPANAIPVFSHLTTLAKAPLGLRGEFTPRFYLFTDAPGDLPAGLAMHNAGPAYGQAFRAIARSARLVIDLADGTPDPARADRLYEIAALGIPIIAEDAEVVRGCFSPGAEIAPFQKPQELVDVVYDLLASPQRQDAMADAARRRLGAPPATLIVDLLRDILLVR